MHTDRGRDIAPDEDRLNYTLPPRQVSLPSHDLHEDTASTAPRHYGIQGRGNFHVYEPMDATPDAVGSIERRVFSPPRRQATNAPDYYKSEENRLTTFRDWKHQRIIAKEDLARNGFVYTGTADKVRCIYCNGILRQWDLGDVVEEEHQRNYPDCPFILGENVGNVPFHPTTNGYHHTDARYVPEVRSTTSARRDQGHDIDPIEDRCGAHRSQPAYTSGHHVSDAVSGANNSTGENESRERCYSTSPRNPRMAVEPVRLATFDGWPAQMKQKPKELAEAGLYYTGDGDKVKCFHCDVLLYNWDPEDDPFVEHARWFPDCEYIRLVKGEDFVRNVKNGKSVHDYVMQTPAVLAVLYEGHTVDTVQKALDAMKAKDGPNTVISADRLLNKVLEIEEAENSTVRHVNGVGVPEDANYALEVRSMTSARRDQGHDIDPIEDGCGAHRSGPAYTNGHHVSNAVSGANNSTGEDESGERCYSTSPRNPRMAVEPDRLATFDGWPAQMKQKPKELAQAGLYYTGDGDKVKCFHCDVLLYNWDPEDDPFVEHARWFPDCEYIRLVKGENFVRDVKNGKNDHDHVMQTPAVEAVLLEGTSVETVQKALDAMRAKNGPNIAISAERLLKTVMEIEKAENDAARHANEDGVTKKPSETNEDLRKRQQCKICLDKDIEMVFFPCKHVACCASCSESLLTCPICRVRIESRVKVYIP